jgi:hypothetical protein
MTTLAKEKRLSPATHDGGANLEEQYPELAIASAYIILRRFNLSRDSLEERANGMLRCSEISADSYAGKSDLSFPTCRKATCARIIHARNSPPNIMTLVLNPCQSRYRLKQITKRAPKVRPIKASHNVNKPNKIFLNDINFLPLY